jgi:hypothetical protein
VHLVDEILTFLLAFFVLVQDREVVKKLGAVFDENSRLVYEFLLRNCIVWRFNQSSGDFYKTWKKTRQLAAEFLFED